MLCAGCGKLLETPAETICANQGGGKPRISLVGFSEKNRPSGSVILSAAKDLSAARREILRCAQDDIALHWSKVLSRREILRCAQDDTALCQSQRSSLVKCRLADDYDDQLARTSRICSGVRMRNSTSKLSRSYSRPIRCSSWRTRPSPLICGAEINP